MGLAVTWRKQFFHRRARLPRLFHLRFFAPVHRRDLQRALGRLLCQLVKFMVPQRVKYSRLCVQRWQKLQRESREFLHESVQGYEHDVVPIRVERNGTARFRQSG